MTIRRIALVLALPAALVLTGCDAAEPVHTPATTEAVYLSALEDHQDPILQEQDADALLTAGWAVCDALSAGEPLSRIVTQGVDAGLGERATGLMIGTAAGSLCPEHRAIVEEYAAPLG